MTAKTVARHKVQWCNRSIEWTAVAVDTDFTEGPSNAMWSYSLGGLTYFGFPFDPVEESTTTRQRALNWLNLHHLILRREHLTIEAI